MLGALLGGPAGGAVGAMVASALGVANAPAAVTEAISTDPEALVKLKQIESDRAVRLQELLVDHAKVDIITAAADRDSARKMQQATGSKMPAILASVVTGGFFFVLAYLIRYGKPDTGGDALLILLGSLGTAWAGIMQFYFGTTSNGARKTELLAQSIPGR